MTTQKMSTSKLEIQKGYRNEHNEGTKKRNKN